MKLQPIREYQFRELKSDAATDLSGKRRRVITEKQCYVVVINVKYKHIV